MNIGSSSVKAALPEWKRQTIAKALAPCENGEGLSQDQSWCGRTTPEHEDTTFYVRETVESHLEQIAMDEVPGKDSDLGQPGRVTVEGTTTVFEKADGGLEYARFDTAERQTENITWAAISADGSFSFVDSSHRAHEGTVYEGLLAGPGAFGHLSAVTTRLGGFAAP